MRPYWLWQKNTKSHRTILSCIVKVRGCAHSWLSQGRGRVRHDRLQRAALFYMESVTSRQPLRNDEWQHREERLGSVLPAYRARKDSLRAQATQTLSAHLFLFVFYHIPFSLRFLPHLCVCVFYHISVCIFYPFSQCIFCHISFFVCLLPHQRQIWCEITYTIWTQLRLKQSWDTMWISFLPQVFKQFSTLHYRIFFPSFCSELHS